MERYDVRTLPDEGATLQEPLAVEWLAAIFDEVAKAGALKWVPTAPGAANLRLMKVDPDGRGAPVVRVSGSVVAEVTTDCVRCLEQVARTFDAPIDVTYFPAAKTVPAAKDDPRQPEDPDFLDALDESTYDGAELDLPELVREGLLIELDLQPTCADEIGCDTRTQALLDSVNPVFEEPEIDPRWDALKRIQLKNE